eukprot:3162498-Prymnesium_polylepis.1
MGSAGRAPPAVGAAGFQPAAMAAAISSGMGGGAPPLGTPMHMVTDWTYAAIAACRAAVSGKAGGCAPNQRGRDGGRGRAGGVGPVRRRGWGGGDADGPVRGVRWRRGQVLQQARRRVRVQVDGVLAQRARLVGLAGDPGLGNLVDDLFGPFRRGRGDGRRRGQLRG